MIPPLFTFSGDAFDNDFDIGLLSEYLFDEDKQGMSGRNALLTNPFIGEFSSFLNEGDEGIIT